MNTPDKPILDYAPGKPTAAQRRRRWVMMSSLVVRSLPTSTVFPFTTLLQPPAPPAMLAGKIAPPTSQPVPLPGGIAPPCTQPDK